MTGGSGFGMKAAVFAFSFFAVVASASGQYRVDSVRQARKAKLERLAQDPSVPLGPAEITHLHHFEPDGAYSVEAAVELLHGEPSFRMPTSDGTSKAYVRYAKARFAIHGDSAELTLYRSLDPFANPDHRDHLFLPFTDLTNGTDTYGAGRYIDLSAADIRSGRLVIDFNGAYNPYCAYSSGYRCPVPPAENNVQLYIRAGERNYTGPLLQRPRPAVPPSPFTAAERRLILAGDTARPLRVIQDTVPDESRILTSISQDIDAHDELLPLLAKRMYLAVTDSLHPGVGIAAPQVGINRNAIWVQRLDKPGEPFEWYVNPRITWRSKLLRKGVEGCLSIADTIGRVVRNYTIRITYQDALGENREELVEGFTAVIFQHEIDHLFGILFTDRLAEQGAVRYERINDEVDLYVKERLRRQ